MITIICFLVRTTYDGLKIVENEWFMSMRKKSFYENSWHYPLLFFVVLLVSEITPNTMFIINLSHILGNKVILSPKDETDFEKKK